MDVKVVNFSPSSLLTVLLTVVFVVLKLCGVIAWSWWWVFAPIWIPLAIVLGIWLIIGLIGLIALIASKEKD